MLSQTNYLLAACSRFARPRASRGDRIANNSWERTGLSPRRSTQSLDEVKNFMRWIFAGILSAGLGFVIWLLFLVVDLASVFVQVSRHMHQHDYHPFSLLDSHVSETVIWAFAFFAGAFLVSSRAASSRCHWSALVGYGCFLAVWLALGIDWSARWQAHEIVELSSAFFTAFAGGFFGERFRRRRKSNHALQPTRASARG